MGYLEQAVRSRWAVPMTAFLIQLSQYWNTLVTVTWWSKRATVSVVWFCVLWLATILLLEIFLNRRFPFPVRCLLGTLVIAGVILTAMLVISLQSEKPWLTLGYDEVRYLIITYTICLLIGSIVLMINKERRHEKEIEMLRIENLSSQYNAIANQISPTSFQRTEQPLVARTRRQETGKPRIHRQPVGHIPVHHPLQGVVADDPGRGAEFHKFVQATDGRTLRRKLHLRGRHPQQALNMRMPSLSLLPLFENIVKHNVIDSEHHMRITISFNDNNELVIANPVYPKLTPPESNGIGLTNLSNRYRLLLGKEIRIEKTEG